MKQNQDSHGTIEQIKAIMEEWRAERMGSGYAMRCVGGALREHDAQEQRLKAISEDARRDREVAGL